MASDCVALHLRIRVKPENRDALLRFLAEARPFYEQPGGITMRLLQQMTDPSEFIEVFEYESRAAYEGDERRVRDDPRMKAYLERWRSLLDGPPVVEAYLEQVIDGGLRDGQV